MASEGSQEDTEPLTCPQCALKLSQKSALTRHMKRCGQPSFKIPRQKACHACSKAKVRCTSQLPKCDRCRLRSITCTYATAPVGPATPSASETTQYPQTREPSPCFSEAPFAFQLYLSEQRRLELLGTAPGTPNTSPIVLHAMRLVVQVLKAWLRLMGARDESSLPPMVHKVQAIDGLPATLARCSSLVRMWVDHDSYTADLMQQTMLQEAERLLGKDHAKNVHETLAAAQSLLFLLTALFFGFDKDGTLPHADAAKILIKVWGIKEELAATGLFAQSEVEHKAVDWHDWALVQAKRRTLCSLSHLEWAWSIQAGYPVLTCFELAPLYAPAAGCLWRESEEVSWRQSYTAWLHRWDGEGYKMAEFFQIDPFTPLDRRSEMWLAEADEFGMVLMAEANAVSPARRIVDAA